MSDNSESRDGHGRWVGDGPAYEKVAANAAKLSAKADALTAKTTETSTVKQHYRAAFAHNEAVGAQHDAATMAPTKRLIAMHTARENHHEKLYQRHGARGGISDLQ